MVRPVCGSPPRGRGKVAGAACRDLLGGITPAWAGKRRCTAACNRLCWDHPRVGGEKIDSLPHRALYLGSPPRGRGKDLVRFYPLCFPGITPAWAGKSRRTVFAVFHPEDHPRVGGEKKTYRGKSWGPRGSPPRGRGKVPGSASGHPAPMDHPRVGGEKAAASTAASSRPGSPPRGRGKAASV